MKNACQLLHSQRWIDNSRCVRVSGATGEERMRSARWGKEWRTKFEKETSEEKGNKCTHIAQAEIEVRGWGEITHLITNLDHDAETPDYLKHYRHILMHTLKHQMTKAVN
jgi:hypothetical protein